MRGNHTGLKGYRAMGLGGLGLGGYRLEKEGPASAGLCPRAYAGASLAALAVPLAT
jgi:hypothetical protein